LIGSTAAIATARQLLAATRLLTITGAGGSGKTRLALAVAEQSAPQFADGLAWVDLGALAAPELVAQAAAAALGLVEEPATTWADLLVERLAARQLLLALDNCEHLAAACAELVNLLLSAAPGLTVLAASREPLGAAGERTWQAPLLGLPSPNASLQQIAEADAVRLFCARAVLAAPAFTLRAGNAAAVARICRGLEGLPLAIELAAARAGVLSPQQIAERLDDSLRLLARQAPLSDARHRTLAAALEWSYRLLPAAEQTLFGRLAVFSGSFGLTAAEAVCTDQTIARSDVLDLIAGLAEKSLLTVLDCGEELRYRLLIPIRQYAAAQLADGEHDRWAARHAAWSLALAEQASAQLDGPQQMQWLRRLAAEHDEMRGALAWCAVAPARAPEGLRLSRALGRFWCLHSHLSEGKRWLETFLGRVGPDDEPLSQVDAINTLARIGTLESNFTAARSHSAQALALALANEYDEGVETAQIGLGLALWELGDYPAAREQLEQIVRYVRPLGHLVSLGRALNSLGLVALHQGDGQAATAFFSESLAVNRQLGNQAGYATALYNLAMQAGHTGDYTRANLLYQEALALQTALGNRSVAGDILVNLGALAAAQKDFGAAAVHYGAAEAIYTELGTPGDNAYVYAGLGEIAFYDGHYEEAQRRYTAALGLFRRAGNRRLIGRALGWLGRIACRRGELAAAAGLCAEALTLRRSIGHQMGIVFSLDIGYAELAAAAGQPAVAARLLGAVEQARAQHERPREPVEARQYESLIARLQEQLSPADLTLCWREGQAMTLDEAAAYALDTLSPAGLAAPRRDLRLFALGRGRVYRGDRLLNAADWTYSKARELVFYLLCHPDSTREQIGLAFWPDANAEQVRKRFSAALAHARSALGRETETIRLVDGRYRLDPAHGYWCDLHEFTAKLQSAQRLLQHGPTRQDALPLLEQATALYQGDLVEDMTADEWPQGRRLALQQQYLDALLLLGGLHQKLQQLDAAIAVYQRALAKDRFAEDAHLELMRCYTYSGRRRDALRQYTALAAALAELGVTPSPAAETLAARIRRNEVV
jgi:predicted ATPase/DNA-binding SARP family transcriptional activator